MSGSVPEPAVTGDSVVCSHCASGNVPQWRDTTAEWVHRWSPATLVPGGRFTITLCLARSSYVSSVPVPDSPPVLEGKNPDTGSVGTLTPDGGSSGGLAGPQTFIDPAPRSDDARGFQGRKDGLANG